MNGAKDDINSYYLNQFGLAGGHVPSASYLMLGQSMLIFIGFNPVDL